MDAVLKQLLMSSQAIVGTCQGFTALASILIFVSMAYFTARNPFVTEKSVLLGF